MAQENSVSFKCYLQDGGFNEIRRFDVNKDVVCNFIYLKEKLQIVFPSLQGREITVMWKDSDGEEVIISNDDELMIALTEQQTDVRKLYVSVKPGSIQNKQIDVEGHPQEFEVTCDGCNKDVEGFRYKCIQCPDFDLCATCEGEGLHAQHCMIRMPNPTSWNPHCKNLAHQLRNFVHNANHMNGTEQRPFNSHGDGKNGHCQFEHHRGHHANHTNGAEQCLFNSHGDGKNGHCQFEHHRGHHANHTNGAEQCLFNSHGDGKNGHCQFEHHRGHHANHVNGAEQCLFNSHGDGKNGHCQFEHHRGHHGVQNSEQQPEVIVVESSADSSAGSSSATTAATADTGTVTKQPIANTSGNGVYMAQPPVHTPFRPHPFSSSRMDFSHPLYHPRPGFGFPHMRFPHHAHPSFGPPHMHSPRPGMRAPPTADAEPMQDEPSVRPHVAEAVEKMMSMGYGNDGGWLTQLLDKKDGDIIKALDVLQPVKRS